MTRRDVVYYHNNYNHNQDHQHHSTHQQYHHKRRRRHVNLTPFKELDHINPLNKYLHSHEESQHPKLGRRIRRDTQQNGENNEIETTTQQRGGRVGNDGVSDKISAFTDDEIGWTRINEEVDIVIPKVLKHFETLGITHLDLPEIRETLSIVSILHLYYSYIYRFYYWHSGRIVCS